MQPGGANEESGRRFLRRGFRRNGHFPDGHSLRDLWAYRRKGWALRHWKRWYFWATHSRLKPVVGVARMIERHLDNVLTYFDHRITNATSEGLNSKIQTVKKTPMGFATGSI
jgi:transposase